MVLSAAPPLLVVPSPSVLGFYAKKRMVSAVRARYCVIVAAGRRTIKSGCVQAGLVKSIGNASDSFFSASFGTAIELCVIRPYPEIRPGAWPVI